MSSIKRCRMCSPKFIGALIILVAALLLHVCTLASDSSAGLIPSENEIARLVKQLGAANFADRESAAKTLTENGFYARDAVRSALSSKDPEVRTRAERIWKSIRWAVFPGAKPEIGKFVSKLESGALDASDARWRRLISGYGVAALPLIAKMSDNPKTASYARSAMAELLADTSSAKLAAAMTASRQCHELKKTLISLKIMELPTDAIKNLFAVLANLKMKFEIVDLIASLWRPGVKNRNSSTADKLLDDPKTADLIYEQALRKFNGAPPSLDNDWKLCFYLADAAKRGRSKLADNFVRELDYHPTNAKVRRFIAKKLLELSLPELALEQLSGDWSATATYLRLVAAKKKGDSEQMEKLRDLLVDEMSESKAKMFAVASVARRFNDPLSEQLYLEMVNTPKFDEFALNSIIKLAGAAEVKGDYANAADLYRKALKRYGELKTSIRMKNGVPLKKFLADRLNILDAIRAGGVDNWRSGMKAILAKNYEEALKRFDAFTRKSPKFAPARSNRAVALEKLGRDTEALKELDAAIRLASPTDIEFKIRCVHRQVSILQKSKNYAAAVKLLEKSVRENPKSLSLLSSLAFNAYFAGEYGKSAEAFKLYRESKPGDIYSVLWRFNALRLLKLAPKPAFAKFADTLTTRRWPRPVVDFYNGAISANQCLNQAKSDDPQRDKAIKCEAYFYLGESLFIDGKREAAERCFEKCLKCDIPEFLESMESEVRLRMLRTVGR